MKRNEMERSETLALAMVGEAKHKLSTNDVNGSF